MLEQRLKNHINTYGAVPVREYQDLVLFDPTGGYYANAQVIGRQGDFITSPEISQVFGEIIALSFINQWHQMGRPDKVLLIELGPGRGIFMADMIRTFKQFGDFSKTLTIYLVEVCPALMQQQKDLLGDTIIHVPTLTAAPESDVTFIIANEFFDALPVEQFIFDPLTKIRQTRLITHNTKDGWHFIPHAPHEQIIETSEASLNVASEIKRRLVHGEGMAIIIDYGDNCEQRTGDTLQAVHKHQRASVFDHMGQADLSHHVDFKALQQLMEPLTSTFITQGEFLIENGINERTEFLAQKHTDMAANLRTGTIRLTAPSAMGSLFKVLTIKH
ncbi:MAG: SAM-dependent methyltransferase [Alphaproteobacteria bacterium]|nr:SAM-dependent methyltransferase [Alphaproteobacteria bacterium]MDP5012266.1 SAM-dependent methyltransferase [Alphaproteobacteria bacterium]